MMAHGNRLLVGGALAIFVAILLGVLTWTALSREAAVPDTPFTLMGTHGETIDQASFRGSPSLVYFGYTHCPSVCPTTLADMSAWLKTLGEDGASLQAFFFTVDPERDTPEIMKSYVAHFSDRIVGVTGDPAEFHKAAVNWLIAADVSRSAEGYSVSHTMAVLLIGPNGKVAGMIPFGMERDEAVARIRDALLTQRTSHS